MTNEEQIKQLTVIVGSIANSVDSLAKTVGGLTGNGAARDSRIKRLIIAAGLRSARIAAMERQWQAYINTLPRQ